MSERRPGCASCAMGAVPTEDQVVRARTLLDAGLTTHDLAHLLAIVDEARDREPDASPCPNCGEWVEEPGEFGVMRHEACGYCAHPSWDMHTDALSGESFWICDICDEKRGPANNA